MWDTSGNDDDVALVYVMAVTIPDAAASTPFSDELQIGIIRRKRRWIRERSVSNESSRPIE